MNGRIGMLSALLGLQLLVIAAVLLMDSDPGAAAEGPFLSFDPAAVETVRISDGDDASVTLTRTADGWQRQDGLPASDIKVEDVLGDLAGLQAPWPVATSAGARERFEVTESTHQRHVVLEADGETVVDLYLGTSPGYQRVHARRAGDDAVFSVDIANYRFPTAADDWLDKTLLAAEGDVTAVVRSGDWRLQRGEEGWLLDDQAADQEAAEQLARRFAELRITGAAAAPAADAQPAAVFEVSDGEGDYQLRVYGDDEADAYVVQSSRREGFFGLASYQAERLLLEQDALLPVAEDQAVDGMPPGDADDAAAESGTATTSR